MQFDKNSLDPGRGARGQGKDISFDHDRAFRLILGDGTVDAGGETEVVGVKDEASGHVVRF